MAFLGLIQFMLTAGFIGILIIVFIIIDEFNDPYLKLGKPKLIRRISRHQTPRRQCGARLRPGWAGPHTRTG